MSLMERIRSLRTNLKWLLKPGSFHQEFDEMRRQLAFLYQQSRSHAWVLGQQMSLDAEDQVVSYRLCTQGIFEMYETELLRSATQPGQIVFDIGANIGYYTLQFARAVGPDGHVVAFEPDPHNFELLRRNVIQNGHTNVTLVNRAVAEHSGTEKLSLNLQNRGDHRLNDGSCDRPQIEVATISVDRFCEESGLSPDLVKMDIQGAEGRALRGMSQTLDRCSAMQMFIEFWPRGLVRAGDDPRSILECLQQHGFEIDVIDHESHRLQTLDIDQVLKRFPVEPDTEMLFTNLRCRKLGQQLYAKAS